MKISSADHTIVARAPRKNLLSKVVDYTQPRNLIEDGVDTSGVQEAPEGMNPIMAGAILGLMQTGWQGAIAGASAGGVCKGLKDAQKGVATQVALGGATGALVQSGIGLGLAIVQGRPWVADSLAWNAVQGAVSGVAAGLSSSAGGEGRFWGSMQGALAMGTQGVFSAQAGGALGLKVAEKTNSSVAALGAGATGGALASSAFALALKEGLYGGDLKVNLGQMALMGAMTGLISTASSNKQAQARDFIEGSQAMGEIVEGVSGAQGVGLASAAGASLASLAPTLQGKALLSVVGSTALGAAMGSFGGEAGKAALFSGLSSVSGGAVGVWGQQVQRNLTTDATAYVDKKWLSKLDKPENSHLIRPAGVVAGALVGGITVGPMMMAMAPLPIALGVTLASVGVGGLKIYRMQEKAEKLREATQAFEDFGAKPGIDYTRVAKAQLKEAK